MVRAGLWTTYTLSVFGEQFKYQHIYLNPADNGLDLYTGIKKWIDRYHNRDHQGIERKKPINIFQNAA